MGSRRSRAVVGVDFDDVVFNFNKYFIPWHNKHFGTNVQYETVHSFSLIEVYGADEHTMTERVRAFTHDGSHKTVMPIDGAKDVIAKLCERYDLHIVTARSETTQPLVLEWLEDHFPKTFQQVHFTNTFGGLHHQVKRTKSAVCKEIGAVVHIEDAPSHAYEVATAGIPVLLLDRPWNRNSSLPRAVTRVHSWNEVSHWMNARH